MVFFITLLFFAIIVACYVLAVGALAPGRSSQSLWWTAFVLLLAPRLAVYFFLVFKHHAGTLALHHMPLFLFLLPEALVLPRHTTWTPPWVAGFTLLLTAGSVLWSWLAVRWVRRKPRPPQP